MRTASTAASHSVSSSGEARRCDATDVWAEVTLPLLEHYWVRGQPQLFVCVGASGDGDDLVSSCTVR